MGLNAGELILIIVLLFVIFGLGRLGDIGEAIGRMKRKALGPPAPNTSVDISPPPSAANKKGAPQVSAKDIAGPTEDAELVEDED